MKNKQDFEFIVDVPPDDYCIEKFHIALARGLINKYGVENMKKILETIEEQAKQPIKIYCTSSNEQIYPIRV